jgi:hypothetical protein
MAEAFWLFKTLSGVSMSQNYLQIRNDYLQKAWARSPGELAACLPATEAAGVLQLRTFGEDCLLTPDIVTLGGKPAESRNEKRVTA